MPTRSRSHELEDESIDKFRAAIPRRWVIREKSRDYGVDLEVEIFAEDRRATGLMFYVQLKATDNIKRERKTSMEVDRIQYLTTLELPAVIVRYCSVSGRLFWLWDFEASNQLAQSTKTATIVFNKEWTDETPENVLKVLGVTRRLKEKRPSERFALACRYELPYAAELIASQALNELLKNLSFIRTIDDRSRVPVEISFFPEHVRITMGLGYLELEINYESLRRTLQTLAYALTAVFMRTGFSDRATTAANYCLSLADAWMTVPRELSLYACVALKGEPLKASKLAIYAGLHRQQDEAFLAFTSELITAQSAEKAEVAAAIQEFYLPAISQAPTDESRGAIMYSMANVRANNHEYAKAIQAFNSARKLRPRYLNADYFLRELGGALFEGRRFRCSAIAYHQAMDLTPDPSTTFCLGDALLHSGDLSKAASTLALLADSEDATLAAEARLKRLLAEWFLERSIDIRLGDADALSRYADEVEAVEEKFLAVLGAAFAARWNRYLWSWALQLSVYVSIVPYISDVMLCAQEACGSEAYAMSRERIMPFTDNEEDLRQLDNLNIKARDVVASRPRRPFVARLIDTDRVMVFERKM
ncbi:DUF4365 domain-containing protein [Rhizobium sp. R635]|uniref:DUF4365 domain-containing protein n=1 Tax=Rhizobium sp. R635 TaxID=1764275 RepID=UPI00167D9773|nr:DUF4365 domain-containing protein [Rhizobium sp. R635]